MVDMNKQDKRTPTVSTPIIESTRVIERALDPVLLTRARELGLPEVAARVVAGRPVSHDRPLGSILWPSGNDLDPPNLKNMVEASERLATAVEAGQRIAVCLDYDADGTDAGAILVHVLTKNFCVFPERVHVEIGHRLKDGYGLTDAMADRLIAQAPKIDLAVTADMGSSDQARIKRLREAGIEVIVTDHHEIPIDGPPADAICVNPVQEGCEYPDPYIAGCAVAWLLCCATRTRLIERGYLREDVPTLSDVFDYLSIGTLADCVSIAKSANNRFFVQAGLRQMQQQTRAPWRALRRYMSKEGEPIRSDAIQFTLGPMLNARSRLSAPEAMLDFLLSEDDAEAAGLAALLNEENTRRKTIERELTNRAKELAQSQIDRGDYSLSVYLPDGHSGVHGITASRLTEAFGRPAAVFSPHASKPGVMTGSLRTIDGFHVRDALQFVADRIPDLFLSFGGHAGAGGCAFEESRFDQFSQAFEAAANAALKPEQIGPRVKTDGVLLPDDISLETVDTLLRLEPYGRDFDYPVFEADLEVVSARPVGQEPVHLSLQVRAGDALHRAIWFRALAQPGADWPVAVGTKARFLVELKDNWYRGQRSINLLVRDLVSPV